MRILMLSWEFPPHVVGGLGKHVAELVPALARQHMDIHLVTPAHQGQAGEEVIEGVTVHRVAAPTVGFPDFYTQAVQTNRALQRHAEHIITRMGSFDLIHNHDWLTSFAAEGLKHTYKLPLVSTVHATERGRGRGYLSGDQAQRINDAEWRLTYESWRVICTTHYMVGEVQEYFGTPVDKVDIVPNGIDPTPFQALEQVDLGNFRRQYAAPDEKLVLYVGRIVHEKGVDTLVRSATQVLSAVPQAKFVVAGKGPELQRLRDLVESLHLWEKVLMAGFISDDERNRLYKVADCAVFPSLYEPFGIVALEAMAARTPVVVSEVGGLREVVRHAETGITIYPNNVDSCAWGIVHTLQHPRWAQQRVDNAYQEVLTVYNWDTIARQTIQVYQRAVDERAHTAW